MSKLVIYASNIKVPSSVLGLLDGSEMFYLTNPYFHADGAKPTDPKTFMNLMKTKTGSVLNGVYILAKDENRPFTSNYVIAYADRKGAKKSFYIPKPYETSKIAEKTKHKLQINPIAPFDTKSCDYKLATLDYQFCAAMDVLLVAAAFEINLAQFAGKHDNVEFYTSFCEAINASIKTKQPKCKEIFAIEPLFIQSLSKIPYIISKNKKKTIQMNPEEPKSKISTLFMKLYEFCDENDVIRMMGNWKSVFVGSGYALPAFVKTGYHKQDETWINMISTKLVFNIKSNAPDAKNFYVTSKQIEKGKSKEFELEDLVDLWGATVQDMNASKGLKQEGCIFIVPRISFGFYSVGNPTIEWRADKVVIKHSVKVSSNNYEDADEFVDDMDDDDFMAMGSGQFQEE